jgi:hypothetical protein
MIRVTRLARSLVAFLLLPLSAKAQATNLARRSEPGTLIRGRHHFMESGHGERWEIGQLA